MRYACLVYFDPEKVFNQSRSSASLRPRAEVEAIIRDSEPYNDELRASGHMVTAAALQMPDQAMTVRMRDGKMSTTDGPFAETKEQLGGYYLIEARDLNEAIQIAGRIPSAKLGCIEVRPVREHPEV